MTDYFDVVFDGPPSHESGRFVEVEDSAGRSIKMGEWVQRPDGYWVLRLPRSPQSEAVQRDAARLDDMERTKCYPFWNGNGWTYIVAPERSSKIERKGVGSTVREAIDAAMRSSAPLEKE